MKKLIVIIFMALIIVGCGQKSEDNKLVVGMELQYPPFETTNAAGEPEGISVDLAYALGEYLNREVEIQNIAWSGLIPAINSKKIDVIISSMSVTEDRKESVSFSHPYAHTSLAILVNKDSGIESIDDLNASDKKVAVKLGTTGYLYAVNNLDKATINTIEKADTGILEVSQGKSDAFIYDQMSIYEAQKQYSDTTLALLEPFADPEPWAMAVSKDNEELLTEINAFITEYQKNGGFDDLGDKYMSEMKKAFKELGLNFFFQPLD